MNLAIATTLISISIYSIISRRSFNRVIFDKFHDTLFFSMGMKWSDAGNMETARVQRLVSPKFNLGLTCKNKRLPKSFNGGLRKVGFGNFQRKCELVLEKMLTRR